MIGDLARLDDYGPEDDPWARGVRAAQGIANAPPPQAPADAEVPRSPYEDLAKFGQRGWMGSVADIGGRMYDIGHGATEFARVPTAQMWPNPYPEGSEEWQFYENHKADQAANWAASNAFSEVFWPRWGNNAGRVTSGAGSKIIQPENPRAKIGGNQPPEEFALRPEDFSTGAAPEVPAPEMPPPTARITVRPRVEVAPGVVAEPPAGIGVLAEPAAPAAPPPSWAAGLPRPQPAARSTDLPDIRGMPVDQAIEIARRQPHLIEAGEQSQGKYIGGPRDIQSKPALNALRNRFDNYVAADPRGWDWYERYRPALERITGGDPLPNYWAAQQHGQWSAGVDPGSELHFVLKEANAALAGMPIKASRPAQHEAHMRALAANDPTEYQTAEKTQQYANQIRMQQELATGRPLVPGATGVNDFRYARQWEYTEPGGEKQKGALTDAQHKFLDMETALAVDRANRNNLGGRSDWTGEQLQAAPWVRQKALDIMSRNPALTYDEAFKRANRTIADYFPEKTYNATHEAQPGADTGHLPQSVNADLAARQEFFNDPRSRWQMDRFGRDAVYAGLKIPGTDSSMRVETTVPMTGMYKRPDGTIEINPGEIAQPLGTFQTPQTIDPNFIGPQPYVPFKQATAGDRAIMNAGEYFRAWMDAQNAGSWHKTWEGGPAWESNSLFYPRPGGGAAPIGDLFALQAAGTPHGLPDVTSSGRGNLLTQFWPPPQGGKDFERAFRNQEFVLPGMEAPRRVRVDSALADLVSQWKEGEGSGAATREMLRHVTATPELRAAFNDNPHLADKALARFERDKDWASRWGAPREDIQNARQIVAAGPGWIDRIEAALKNGSISLPAVAGLIAGAAAVRQQKGQQQGGAGREEL